MAALVRLIGIRSDGPILHAAFCACVWLSEAVLPCGTGLLVRALLPRQVGSLLRRTCLLWLWGTRPEQQHEQDPEKKQRFMRLSRNDLHADLPSTLFQFG